MPRNVETITLQTGACHIAVVLAQQCGMRMFKIVEVGKEGIVAHGQRVVGTVGDERVDAEDVLPITIVYDQRLSVAHSGVIKAHTFPVHLISVSVVIVIHIIRIVQAVNRKIVKRCCLSRHDKSRKKNRNKSIIHVIYSLSRLKRKGYFRRAG